jgi:hypothetical protein
MDFEEVKLENLPPYTPSTYPPQYEGKPRFPHPEVTLQVVAPQKRPRRKGTIIIILMILGAVLAVAIVVGAWHNAMNANKADVKNGTTEASQMPKAVSTTTTTIVIVTLDTVTGFPSIPFTHMSEVTGSTSTVTPISVPGETIPEPNHIPPAPSSTTLVPGHENNPLPAPPSMTHPSTGIPANLLPDPGVDPSTGTAAAAATTSFDNPYGNDDKM